MKKLFILLLSVVSICSVTFSIGYAKSIDEIEPSYFHEAFGVSNIKVVDENNLITVNGSLGAGGSSSSLVVNDQINLTKPVEFDFSLPCNLSNYPTEPLSTYYNRSFALTLNEYPIENGKYNLKKNTTYWGTSDSGNPEKPQGIQMDFVSGGKNWGEDGYGPEITVFATGQYGSRVLLNSKPENSFDYLSSAFYGNKVNNVEASSLIKGKFYYGIGDDAGNFIFEMQARDKKTNELAGNVYKVSVPVSRLSANGDFTSNPMLGIRVYNGIDYNIDDLTYSIGNIINGRVSTHKSNPSVIENLKPGEDIILKQELKAYSNLDELKDITFTYSSSNPELVSVSDNGVVSTKADGGSAEITVTSSEGTVVKIPVSIFDDTKPMLELDTTINFPQIAYQHQETMIPLEIADDNSGEFISNVTILSPENIVLQPTIFENKKIYYAFTPIKSSLYKIEYYAKDSAGNESKIIKDLYVQKSKAETSFDFDSTQNSTVVPIYTEDGLTMKGSVGNGTNINKAVGVYKNPITFYKQKDNTYSNVEFDLRFNSIDKGIIASGQYERADFSRYFGIMLNQAYFKPNGSLDLDYFSLGTPNGFQLMLGVAPHWNSNDMLRYELFAGGKRLSAQHTSAIDTRSLLQSEIDRVAVERNNIYGKGEDIFLDWKNGSMLDIANKYYNRGTMHFLIKYIEEVGSVDAYYLLQIDDVKMKIPANKVTSNDNGFTKQAYLAFTQYSEDGEINIDATISNVKVGDIKKVEFDKGNVSKNKINDKFKLTPKLVTNIDYISKYTFSSDNESVATVDENGNVNVVGVGFANIYAYSDICGKSAVYSIEVPIENLLFASSKLVVNVNSEFKAKVSSLPIGALPKFYSSNKDLCLVLRDGTLQALKPGKVIITADYFGIIATCEVEIIQNLKTDEEKPSEGCGILTFKDDIYWGGILLIIMASFLLLWRRNNVNCTIRRG